MRRSYVLGTLLAVGIVAIAAAQQPPLVKWQDFVDYGEFNRLFLEHARASMKAGKTPEQAMMDLKLPDKFKDYTLTGGHGGPGGNFGVVYQELQKQ